MSGLVVGDANYDMKKAGLVGYISGLPVTNFGHGTVMVRSLVEAAGATVNWDDKTRIATFITKGANTLVLKVGASEFTWNGKITTLDSKLI